MRRDETTLLNIVEVAHLVVSFVQGRETSPEERLIQKAEELGNGAEFWLIL